VRRGLSALLAATAISVFGPGSAAAAPGDLDPTFGNGGKAVIDLGGNDLGGAVAVQPDGKILVSGGTDAPPASSRDFMVARLTSAGALDRSYGLGTGYSRIDFSGGSDSASALIQQPDGKILVAGTATSAGGSPSNPNFDWGLTRLLNPEGTLDPSLVGNGRQTFSLMTTDYGTGVDLQGEKIIVAGTTGNDCGVARKNSDGSYDGGFAGGVIEATVNFGGSNDICNAVAVQGDGKIVVVGYNGSNFAVARLLPAGAPDTSFNGTGQRVLDLPGAAQAVAIQSDGKIVVAGNSGNDFGVYRLLPNGSSDSSFGDGGKLVVSVGATDQAGSVAIQANGKIVIAGSASTNNEDFAAVRLQPAGILDQTFGNGGKATVDIGSVYDHGSGMALQKDGKIVIAGYRLPGFTAGDIAVARLEGDPPDAAAKSSRCAGKKGTIIGTNKRDKLNGTRKRDVITGLAGKDTIKGLKGNDLICGGKGPDKLIGGPGKDTLLGEKQKDKLFGGPQKDKLLGGAAKDLIVGGGARDKINGGAGKDSERQ